ncbi:hypothetical protein CLV99_2306 [Sphingobacterium yanglingense]|uniref:Immunity protein 30 of polymorphic toxin system n=2 Tax=Sphingobacterium yanglingense TaxID=1437280 RepID=A0A4R6WEZ0_9SPHI|nr:hypothetical protein CLV99_2306 [Sphingobacterium yanglingense]
MFNRRHVMKKNLKEAVESKNEQRLMQCIDYRRSDSFDNDCYEYIEKALVGTWHSRHEDLVDTIYLERLTDDRFVDPILNIALNQEQFRWYDDELEATLRKCVHALKTINTEKSNQALKQLEDLNNDNVKYALEMWGAK